MCLTAFAARVKKGSYDMVHQIKLQGVTQSLAAIGKTIKMSGLPNSIYFSPQKYHLQIERCVEGMRRKDTPEVPQLAVPSIVPEEMPRAAYADDCPKERSISDLGVVKLYYVLRVVEYTKLRMTTLHRKRLE